MARFTMLCCLCGDDEVRFLLVDKMPEWLGAPEIRKLTGNYRVEPFCMRCVHLPQAAGGRLVSIEMQAAPAQAL